MLYIFEQHNSDNSLKNNPLQKFKVAKERNIEDYRKKEMLSASFHVLDQYNLI